MPPTGDDLSAAASFRNADDEYEDGDFHSDTNPNPNTAGAGERRPLFQRLWTEEDEIVILRGFAEFTAARGTAFASHQYDTDPFYEDMRRRLQLGFSKSQLVEKLRRLKRKYRNCVARLRGSGAAFSFRSPHEQAVFEIARNIWRPSNNPSAADSNDDAAVGAANASPSVKVRSPSSRRRRRRRRMSEFTDANAAVEAQPPHPAPMTAKMEDTPSALPQTPLPATATMTGSEPAGPPATPPPSSVILDAEKSALTPLYKEMIRAMLNIGSNTVKPSEPLVLGVLPFEGEKWRKQRILELEVYLKRIDLLQDQVKSALEELKSTPAG